MGFLSPKFPGQKSVQGKLENHKKLTKLMNGVFSLNETQILLIHMQFNTSIGENMINKPQFISNMADGQNRYSEVLNFQKQVRMSL